jgi:hypothetical protein
MFTDFFNSSQGKEYFCSILDISLSFWKRSKENILFSLSVYRSEAAINCQDLKSIDVHLISRNR